MAAFNAQRAVGLLERAMTAREPTAALRALTALRKELDALERQQVARALAEGKTFTAIAQPLGISRQAAHRRYRDLTGAPALSPEARAALIRAREEATRHGSYCIDSRHLLIALAGSGALVLDVERARRSLAPPPNDAQAPKGLHPALRSRLARSPRPLQLQHLLRAALADAGARELLEHFGADGGLFLDDPGPGPDAEDGPARTLGRYREAPLRVERPAHRRPEDPGVLSG
jgi:hypothetical protein